VSRVTENRPQNRWNLKDSWSALLCLSVRFERYPLVSATMQRSVTYSSTNRWMRSCRYCLLPLQELPLPRLEVSCLPKQHNLLRSDTTSAVNLTQARNGFVLPNGGAWSRRTGT
jgi:hypothetical protein